MKLKAFASSIGGREQLAIEMFADALEIIPWTLAENAGMDMIDTLIKLRSHYGGKQGFDKHFGVDVLHNTVGDMYDQGVIEPLRVKTQAIESAAEVANMILRIDDVIASKKGAGGPPRGGPGGMPPGMGGGMPGMM
jgi:chaperonin GroEL (HSP60 family)